jgi:hypothetical protein
MKSYQTHLCRTKCQLLDITSVRLQHSVCPIFMICTIIPFIASLSSILRSKAHPCSRINHTCTTVSLFCPDSISCICGQNESHTKLKHSLHIPNCLRSSHLESPDTKLQTLSSSRNKSSTRIISCKLTSVIRCHRILPCKF